MSDLDTNGDEILTLWHDALLQFGMLCKGKQAALLQGKRFKRYDAQGLDPISLAYGRLQALQPLHPLLEEELLTPHPVAIAQGCAEDALDDFRQQIKSELMKQAA